MLDDVKTVGEQGDVRAFLSAADLFLLPSATESFGLAALEAMACEVPVVASRVGGLPEVIENGVSGYLHEPDDLDGMAASGVALLSDAGLRQRIGMAGKKRRARALLLRPDRAAVRAVLRGGAWQSQ